LRFFALVRDAIASVPQALAPADWVRKQVQIQAEACGLISRLPRGTALPQYIRSVLVFMAMPAEVHAAFTLRGSQKYPAAPPEPLLEFDDSSQSYRWVAPRERTTDAALLPLEAMHYERFVSQHGGAVGAGGAKGLHAQPMKGQKAALTLPPGSAEQLSTFRRQEEERFASPDMPFTYTLRDGSSSSVAPIGKKGGSGKAREHFLLRPERPAAATLLVLVRDAAARMPGGEGSRADVCELLKESSFVIEGVNDAQISQVPH
jgi:nuclear factor related to kappa-B-binding protein